jgi:DNA gyrase subunit A
LRNKKEKIEEKELDFSKENIVLAEYSEEMKQSFLDYSMSVLVARAVPDIRDGLKPVHRRILYTMKELGLTHDKPHKKSANVVGQALANFHPHGDASVYEAMVNLSHDFSLTTPFVDGHGNFGSIEGDAYASSRYTEARLQKYTEDVVLADVSKQLVNYIPNYDNSRTEPEVLPAKVPNVLINGTNGIAVGTTTNTPTHNLAEVIDTYIAYLKNEKISIEDLIKLIHGPDFPTGGIIVNKNDLPEIYRTGKGKIKIRGKIEIEPATKRGEHDKLVVTEIPYSMVGLGIEKFLSDVADLAKNKVLPEITDILNQTSSKGIRLVVELKNGSDIKRVENILYKKTKLEDTLPVNMLYVVNGRPITLNLKQILEEFGKFNYETKTRKYKALLEKNKELKEIKEGLITAIDSIDAIIEVLRGSSTVKIAKECLMGKTINGITFRTKTAQKIASKFEFSDLQAQAILDMKMSRLINLELNVLIKEKEEAEKNIKNYEKILASKTEMKKIIISELELIKKQYKQKRKTMIKNAITIDVDVNTFEEEEVVITYDKYGYIKLFDIATYNRNKENLTESVNVIESKNTSSLFVFTDKGNVHQIKIKDIPFCKFKDRGIPVDNISNYDSSKENLLVILPIEKLQQNHFVVVTNNNLIKAIDGNEFITVRKTIPYTKLEKDATVIGFGILSDGKVIIQSSSNYFLNIQISTIPVQKRTSLGVKCINLKDGEVIKNVYFTSVKQKEIIIPENNKTIKIDKIKEDKRASTGYNIKI